jgi:DNA/RNA-binding domain of Phe-tRNA-synthetase-like protein
VFMLVVAIVSWRSFKQTVLTKSTTEAELVALETNTNEAKLLTEAIDELTFC